MRIKSINVIKRDKNVISQCVTREKELPFVIEKGKGVHLYDADGKKYLDFAAGIAVMNAGYGVKEINNAVKKQLSRLMHSAFSDFYAELPVIFAEKICSAAGKPYDNLFFSNSGTESVEAGLKAAFRHTKRQGLIAFYKGFHGRTLGALSATCAKTVHKKNYPGIKAVHAEFPNPYRTPKGISPNEYAVMCVENIEKRILKRELAKEDCAAIIVEPVLGEGGYVVPPKIFHKELRKLCNQNNILLIADEVQAGVWRTGEFLAMKNFGIKADITCMAKAIGGGLPLGVTISNKKLFDWEKGAHANTFGGNLLACAAGLATIKYLKKQNIGLKVKRKGKKALRRLNEIKNKYSCIGDVRGLGLMIGVEFVKNNKKEDPKIRNKILGESFKNGLVLLPCGDSCIRISPPLVISDEELEKGLDIFESLIKKSMR